MSKTQAPSMDMKHGSPMDVDDPYNNNQLLGIEGDHNAGDKAHPVHTLMDQVNNTTLESLKPSVGQECPLPSGSGVANGHVLVNTVGGEPSTGNPEWSLPPTAPDNVEEDAPVVQSFMFLRQPDGSYDMITMEEPFIEQEITVREIVMEDGPLIVLTGSNGEVHYNPEDTVTLDIDDDARLFLIDPGDSVVCYVNVEGAGRGESFDILQKDWEQVIDQIIGSEHTEPPSIDIVLIANENDSFTENIQIVAKPVPDDDNPSEPLTYSPEMKKRRLGMQHNYPSP